MCSQLDVYNLCMRTAQKLTRIYIIHTKQSVSRSDHAKCGARSLARLAPVSYTVFVGALPLSRY